MTTSTKTKPKNQGTLLTKQTVSMFGHAISGHRPANQPGNKQDNLASNGTFLMHDDICSDMLFRFTKFLMELPNTIDSNFSGEIKIIINSRGGSVSDGFGIIDAMQSSSVPISTIITGTAASMASIIACSGYPGKRYIGANSRVMTHQFFTMTWGSDTEIQNDKTNHKQIRNMIIDQYVRNSNLNKEQVKKYLYNALDQWLTAEQVLKYGLADKLLPDDFKKEKK